MKMPIFTTTVTPCSAGPNMLRKKKRNEIYKYREEIEKIVKIYRQYDCQFGNT